MSGRRRAQPFDCPLDGRDRALFGEVHRSAISGVRTSASIRWRTCCWRWRRTLAKAEGASYFASFVLALFLAEEHLGRPDSLRRIVPSVTTQLHMPPPWRRLPLTDCPAPSTAARSALVELTFSSLPRCAAENVHRPNRLSNSVRPWHHRVECCDRQRSVGGRRGMTVLVVPCGVGRGGTVVLCVRRTSRRKSHLPSAA